MMRASIPAGNDEGNDEVIEAFAEQFKPEAAYFVAEPLAISPAISR